MVRADYPSFRRKRNAEPASGLNKNRCGFAALGSRFRGNDDVFFDLQQLLCGRA